MKKFDVIYTIQKGDDVRYVDIRGMKAENEQKARELIEKYNPNFIEYISNFEEVG